MFIIYYIEVLRLKAGLIHLAQAFNLTTWSDTAFWRRRKNRCWRKIRDRNGRSDFWPKGLSAEVTFGWTEVVATQNHLGKVTTLQPYHPRFEVTKLQPYHTIPGYISSQGTDLRHVFFAFRRPYVALTAWSPKQKFENSWAARSGAKRRRSWYGFWQYPAPLLLWGLGSENLARTVDPDRSARIGPVQIKVRRAAFLVNYDYDYNCETCQLHGFDISNSTVRVEISSLKWEMLTAALSETLTEFSAATWLLVSVGKVELHNCNSRDGSEVML